MNARKLAKIRKIIKASVNIGLSGMSELKAAKRHDSDGGAEVTRAEVEEIARAVFAAALDEILSAGLDL